MTKTTSRKEVLGIDVGGSGIKGAIVDPLTGELVTKRQRIPTPAGFRFGDVVGVIDELARLFAYDGPIGVGFPTVVVNGVVMAPPTALDYPGWVGFPLADNLSKKTGCPVTVINDADAACLAEMTFGAGQDQAGVVLVFTLGTGIGSGLFHDGRLVPNSELGQLHMPGSLQSIEDEASDRVRSAQDLSWEAWGSLLNDYFLYVETLFSPEVIIVGGGVSKKHEKFFKYIETRAKLLPAAFRNEAGIVGAAMAAVEPNKSQAT